MNEDLKQQRKTDALERKAVTVKLENLDGTVTFNCETLNFEYLKKLHKYLFGDLFPKDLTDTRPLSDEDKKIIKKMLILSNETCKKEPENIKKIIDLLHEVWYIQPFFDGNTRTLIAYLIMLKKRYYLDINIDIHNDLRRVITSKKLELIKNNPSRKK